MIRIKNKIMLKVHQKVHKNHKWQKEIEEVKRFWDINATR